MIKRYMITGVKFGSIYQRRQVWNYSQKQSITQVINLILDLQNDI